MSRSERSLIVTVEAWACSSPSMPSMLRPKGSSQVPSLGVDGSWWESTLCVRSGFARALRCEASLPRLRCRQLGFVALPPIPQASAIAWICMEAQEMQSGIPQADEACVLVVPFHGSQINELGHAKIRSQRLTPDRFACSGPGKLRLPTPFVQLSF